MTVALFPPVTGIARPVKYFHGGIPGLKPGQLVLPPTTTGTGRTLAEHSEQLGGEHVRRDRVYLAASRDVAKAYAAFYPDGALYAVEPRGHVEPDPDCSLPGLSWQCEAAEVLTVVDPVVLFRSRTPERWLRMLTPSAAQGLR
ncbi:hypothetical protein [Streptomyces sp. BBFR109]|uniref:hypothetical protein n=1 Tax=Streptomyces sp. BBFR109 TaxID=3448172 RepID=UPI003F776723